ncbi:2Fe-2S ferredoxin [Anopheles sinensis]|uniref:2Fe-2S ferredoxin n=1 Tax=Anopheles sinensis TaxID=74873 RepID=A0A084W5F0_ANOSI|nr:2Fe-2S ferredoxin [Anopheles sinensis]
MLIASKNVRPHNKCAQQQLPKHHYVREAKENIPCTRSVHGSLGSVLQHTAIRNNRLSPLFESDCEARE